MSNITWGLQRDITPRLGTRLVQEGNRLHYPSLTGPVSPVSSVTPNARSWMKHSRTLSARWNRC